VKDERSFSRWVTLPEVLIALSAILIGVCSLFVAIYETSLTRKAQHASVWPHVDVAPSFRGGEFSLGVINSGVGPARIEAAWVSHSGERKQDWTDALSAVTGQPPTVDGYASVINGRVLPAGEREVILAFAREGAETTALISAIREHVIEGTFDVSVCYCSVFDECWVASMQEVVERSRGISVSRDSRRVRSCDNVPVSGI